MTTHVCAYAHTHARTHLCTLRTHIITCTHMHASTCTHTHVHLRPRLQIHAHRHAHTHALAHTCTCHNLQAVVSETLSFLFEEKRIEPAHTAAELGPEDWVRMHTQVDACICVCHLIPRYLCSHANPRAHTHTRAQAHVHVHRHACTRKRTHERIRTHARTQ